MTAVLEQSVSIAAEPPDQAEVHALIADLNAYLLSFYLPEACHHMTVAELSEPNIVFFVARERGKAVGCGALRVLSEEEGEVKRMYVAPGQQGRGLGRLILTAIEERARDMALARLLLETGDQQPAALNLYRSAGFAVRGPYLDYPDDGVSIFMEKRLSN
ncbi:putative acetyltransferase [Rhodopseudomonas julia]|uniref:Acetyltransferase n=1 Tax=Rhodopseudomonas julia TaxID=200617 RepID=A0ABU0C7J3_9BRAD|nr:GNAT family N-acetyltransferase [Rhodopseudomonas julia]MDQ0326493.1 putative acetyltransferase [Rhodopseudomonas julia]